MILQDMITFCLAVAELWKRSTTASVHRAYVFDSLIWWQDLTYIWLGDTYSRNRNWFIFDVVSIVKQKITHLQPGFCDFTIYNTGKPKPTNNKPPQKNIIRRYEDLEIRDTYWNKMRTKLRNKMISSENCDILMLLRQTD